MTPDEPTGGKGNGTTGGETRPPHDCVFKRIHDAWNKVFDERGWLAGLIVTVILVPAVALAARHIFYRSTSVTVAFGAGLVTWLFASLVLVLVLRDHFASADRNSWRRWKRRRFRVLVLLVLIPLGFIVSTAPWLAFGHMAIPISLGLILSHLLWVIVDREGHAHASWRVRTPRFPRTYQRATGATLGAVAFFLALFMTATTAWGVIVSYGTKSPQRRSASSSSTPPTTRPKSAPSGKPSTPQGQPPAGNDGSGTPPVNSGSTNCEWGVGQLGPSSFAPSGVQSWMEQVAVKDAPQWGCLLQATELSDGSYYQPFQQTSAFLIATPYGAGLVDDEYSSILLGSAPPLRWQSSVASPSAGWIAQAIDPTTSR